MALFGEHSRRLTRVALAVTGHTASTGRSIIQNVPIFPESIFVERHGTVVKTSDKGPQQPVVKRCHMAGKF